MTTDPKALAESHRDLLASAEEIELLLRLAFEDGALPPETVAHLCIDPYGLLADLRANIAAARKLTEPT